MSENYIDDKTVFKIELLSDSYRIWAIKKLEKSDSIAIISFQNQFILLNCRSVEWADLEAAPYVPLMTEWECDSYSLGAVYFDWNLNAYL